MSKGLTIVFIVRLLFLFLITCLYLAWKRSSGWLESWEGLFLASDVSTTCAEVIFRAIALVSWKFRNSGDRFDWSIDRVAYGKCVMWSAEGDLSMLVLGLVLRRCLNFPRVSSNAVFEEWLPNSFIASPLMKPFLTPRAFDLINCSWSVFRFCLCP